MSPLTFAPQIVINEGVKLVLIQFRFNKYEQIPSIARNFLREAEGSVRQHAPTGVMPIPPTPRCCLYDFPEELHKAGFELIGITCEERPNTGNQSGNSTHFIVRYTFGRWAEAEIYDPTFWGLRMQLWQELYDVCAAAIWQVRGYLNPFYKDGKEVPGEHATSVNLERREPFLRPDGTSVTEWQKDAAGERVGDAPLPLAPKHNLHIMNGAITLV